MVELNFAVTNINRYSAAARVGHFAAATRIFKYLHKFPSKWLTMDASEHVPPGPLEPVGDGSVNWKEYYPNAYEEIDSKFPSKRSGIKPLSTTVYFDSNWAHDEVTRRSVSGCITFIGNTPVVYFSKRQKSIATSTYSAELIAAKMGAEEAVSIRYMLRAFGVPVEGPTIIAGDNLGTLKKLN